MNRRDYFRALETPHSFIKRVVRLCLGSPTKEQAIIIDEALVRVRALILVKLKKEEAVQEEML